MTGFDIKVELDNIPTDEELEKMTTEQCRDLCLEKNWFLPMDKKGLKVDPKEWIRYIREYSSMSFPTMSELDDMDDKRMRLFSFIKGWIYPWEINYFSMMYKVKFNPRDYLDEIMKDFGDGSGNIDNDRVDEVLNKDHDARLAFIEKVVKKTKG